MSIRSNQEFFDELREWSERKLKILQGYIDPFVKVLGKPVHQVYYVDAFAGAGVYRDGEVGSAIRAAELALSYQQQGKPYRLKCINIESNKENFENLEANTAAYKDLVLNLYGTFSENIGRVLAETSGSPALFFLDPFGVKGIDWDLVKKVIHRGNISDLWIRFDEQAVIRLKPRYGADDPGAEKSFDILCRTYGISNPELLHTELSGDLLSDKKQVAVSLYIQRLTQEFSKVRRKGFVASYPIRAITEHDKYSLVFATGHILGAIIASELVCGVEETYQREVEDYKASRPRQLSLFDKAPTEEEIFEEKVTLLLEAIWNTCKGKKLSRPEVYERIWSEWFGKIRSKHFNDAIKRLQNDDRIVESTGAPSDPKTVFTFRN
jgi:three-Cys-motif partner protein